MVTGSAFELFICVLDVFYFSIDRFLVAFGAGHAGMLAIQGESGLLMIEIHGFPILRSMAGFAISNSFFNELIMMPVGVATVAIGG